MYEELVKRLREHNGWALNETLDEAADAIKELTKDLERSKEWESFWEKEANEALRKLQVAAARTAEGGNMKVELTESEAASLLDYLEINFIQNVKDNPDVDSMLWMDNMLSIWRKCGGRNQYGDGEE